MTKDKKIETINLAPSWKTATQIYLAAFEHGNTEGKGSAAREILNIGENMDNAISEISKLNSRIVDLQNEVNRLTVKYEVFG